MQVHFDRHELLIDRRISLRYYLSKFKKISQRINKEKFQMDGDPYNLKVELIGIDSPMKLYDVFRLIRDMNDRRFLNTFELLSLDRKFDRMQFHFPILTDRFALGALYIFPERERHGRVLSWRDDFDSIEIGSFVRFATSPYTEIDKILLEEPCKVSQVQTLRLMA
jgi:hypothetical protein